MKNVDKKIVIGNWKMNPVSFKQAEKLFKDVSKNISKVKKTQVVVAAPSIYLEKLNKISKKIPLSAQNSFIGETGAFTGELSPEMLYSVGARYVILGHSERRALGEDNILINKKIKSVLSASMTPVLCIGESDRDVNHMYLDFVKTQITECLAGVNKNSLADVIIAYEPIWALSSTVGRHDFVPAEFLEIKIFIKKILSDMFGAKVVLPRIIYGGSVNPKNAQAFIVEGEADGLLPGKASLDAKKFLEIINIVENCK